VLIFLFEKVCRKSSVKVVCFPEDYNINYTAFQGLVVNYQSNVFKSIGTNRLLNLSSEGRLQCILNKPLG